ncbi:Uncharacterized protein SCF082_LOCUS36193 [Durusdinium trenchii]
MGDIEGGSCATMCFEADGVHTKEQLIYKGQGMGSYSQVSSMEMVGKGRGDFEKERVQVASGSKLRLPCIGAAVFAVVLLLAIGIWRLLPPTGASDPCMSRSAVGSGMTTNLMAHCCSMGHQQFCAHSPVPKPQVHVDDQYYTQVRDVPVPHVVPVPVPPPPRQVIEHKVYVHHSAFDCDAGSVDWKHQWSGEQQRYCCYKSHIACTTKINVRPHFHTITHYKTQTVPVHVAIPAPPAQVVNHVVNVPIHDPPRMIRVPVPGQPNVVPKYVHQKHYVPVPEASPPTYHSVPVPVPVREPGHVIPVPAPLPSQTVVRNKVIYKTRHVKMGHVGHEVVHVVHHWGGSHHSGGSYQGAGDNFHGDNVHVVHHYGGSYHSGGSYHGAGDNFHGDNVRVVHHYGGSYHSGGSYHDGGAEFDGGSTHAVHHYSSGGGSYHAGGAVEQFSSHSGSFHHDFH